MIDIFDVLAQDGICMKKDKVVFNVARKLIGTSSKRSYGKFQLI